MSRRFRGDFFSKGIMSLVSCLKNWRLPCNARNGKKSVIDFRFIICPLVNALSVCVVLMTFVDCETSFTSKFILSDKILHEENESATRRSKSRRRASAAVNSSGRSVFADSVLTSNSGIIPRLRRFVEHHWGTVVQSEVVLVWIERTHAIPSLTLTHHDCTGSLVGSADGNEVDGQTRINKPRSVYSVRQESETFEHNSTKQQDALHLYNSYEVLEQCANGKTSPPFPSSEVTHETHVADAWGRVF